MALTRVLFITFFTTAMSSMHLSASRKTVGDPETRAFIGFGTTTLTERPCICVSTVSCSCCETVRIFYTGEAKRLCFNMIYQTNGLNFDLSLDTLMLKSMTVANYRPFQMCAPVPGLLFSSICVSILELNQFPRSFTICPRVDVIAKQQRWYISYVCSSISNQLPGLPARAGGTAAAMMPAATGGGTMATMPAAMAMMMAGAGAMTRPGAAAPAMGPASMMVMMPAAAAGARPAGVMPPGMMPAGMMPAGMMPAGMMPAGMMPAGMMPAGMIPAGMMPAGMMPAGMMPAGMMPGGAAMGQRPAGVPAPMPPPGGSPPAGGAAPPGGARPPGGMAPPGGAQPPGGMAPPGGARPPGGMAPPGGAQPPGGMAPPGGARPPGGMAPPGGARPPGGMAPPGGAQPPGGMAPPGGARPPGGMAPPGGAAPPPGAMPPAGAPPPGVIMPRPGGPPMARLAVSAKVTKNDEQQLVAENISAARETTTSDTEVVDVEDDFSYIAEPVSEDNNNVKERRENTDTIVKREIVENEKRFMSDHFTERTSQTENDESNDVVLEVSKRNKRQAYDMFDLFHQSNRCERAYRICITRSRHYIVSRLRNSRNGPKNKNNCFNKPARIVHGSAENLCPQVSEDSTSEEVTLSSISEAADPVVQNNDSSLEAIVVHDEPIEGADVYPQSGPYIVPITSYNRQDYFPMRTPPLVALQIKQQLSRSSNDTFIFSENPANDFNNQKLVRPIN